ncbi:CDP-alcohol phosphatidyltransferase family protein [Chloroflexota bacterium]
MTEDYNENLRIRPNVPNAVTLSRIILVVVVCWLLIMGNGDSVMLPGFLIIVAWLTDGLDGFLARRLGQSSLGGAIFDLVADRFLMTPVLVISVAKGLWNHTTHLMPLNPYPYAVILIIADMAVLAGVFSYLWKQRSRAMEFPTPTQIARYTYSIQMVALIVGIMGLGPPLFIASLMYLAIIFTLIAAYSYLRKGGYVFTS